MTPLEERLHEALFYKDPQGKTLFRYSDPRVTVEDDPYIGQLVPEIIKAIGTYIRTDSAVTSENDAHLAIVCRRHNSDLITIWSRPPTSRQANTELQWCRDNKSDDYVFGLVEL